MHRFFIPADHLRGKQVFLAGSQAHQIRDVLRMKPGDSIIVLDNSGIEYIVSLTKIERQEVIGNVNETRKSEAEPGVHVTLYQSLLAREKFEFILQKCTEVGVSRFVPVVTQRSIVRRPEAITAKKMSRWQSILTEAAEQSGRGKIPILDSPLYFSDALTRLGTCEISLVGSIQGNELSLRQFLESDKNHASQIALLIGPEGGFAEHEIADACSGGAKAFSLGKRVLRAETAAIVASALILYELDR